MWEFLGFDGYHRRFVKDYVTIVAPIINLTKRNVKFVCDESCSRVFESLKSRLTAALVLAFPCNSCGFLLDLDPNDCVIGAVISQLGDGQDMVLA